MTLLLSIGIHHAPAPLRHVHNAAPPVSLRVAVSHRFCDASPG